MCSSSDDVDSRPWRRRKAFRTKSTARKREAAGPMDRRPLKWGLIRVSSGTGWLDQLAELALQPGQGQHGESCHGGDGRGRERDGGGARVAAVVAAADAGAVAGVVVAAGV